MIRFFAEHPTAANLLMIFFLVIGAVTLPTLRRETFPDFSEDKVQIAVVYPGATAEDVEDAICRRIEDAVDGISYVKEVTSESKEGVGSVTVEMQSGGDMATFLMDIKTAVDAIADFPDQAEDPVVKELNRTDAVVSIAVSGPMAETDLKNYCEDLKDRLKQDAGVSLVTVSGFSERQIRIQIPAAILIQYGISLDDIARCHRPAECGSARRFNRNPGSGHPDPLHRRTQNPMAFEDLVVYASDSGAEIHLGEIARIRDQFELAEDKFMFNGQRAGLLAISKTKVEDALTVFDAVEAFVEREQEIAPARVKLTLTKDSSSIVRDRLQLLVKNGLQGLLLVFLTMWLFFNLRLSFWVTMGLPVSFFGAFFLMPQIDYSLNMLTMVGLLIALGLLMDDAIVLAENVASHLARENPPWMQSSTGWVKSKTGSSPPLPPPFAYSALWPFWKATWARCSR
jgi:HAE1 family hydrophobic/amphiphilic exporter-1